MQRYLVQISYTIDGTPRTHSPRSIEAASATDAKCEALMNFKQGRDGKRVKVTGARIV